MPTQNNLADKLFDYIEQQLAAQTPSWDHQAREEIADFIRGKLYDYSLTQQRKREDARTS